MKKRNETKRNADQNYKFFLNLFFSSNKIFSKPILVLFGYFKNFDSLSEETLCLVIKK